MNEISEKLILLTAGVYDTQLAITQILLRNGWELGSTGKVIKKVKSAFQGSLQVFSLDTHVKDKILVKDREGRVTAKIDLFEAMTNDQIMEAAKTLNQGVKSLRA